MNLHLEIVTPEKIILKDDVDEVIAPTINGEIGILPNHVSLFTKIKPGELLVKKGGKYQSLAITGGFLEVSQNNVNILADYAVRAEDIEVAKARLAQERAQKLMSEKSDKREFAVAEADLRRALVELQVARKLKKSTPS